MTDEKLTHLDERGHARMVDVGDKPETERLAVARSVVLMRRETLALIESGATGKGDVFAVARIAGIMAAKRTAELIPLCHPLALTQIQVDLTPEPPTAEAGNDAEAQVVITAQVRTRDRTGVEMEALVAASIAALTLYDMCKAVDRAMVIGETWVAEKRGGKSGTFLHPRHPGHAPIL
jgi:cyclic pyranopterin monophosphate synthase